MKRFNGFAMLLLLLGLIIALGRAPEVEAGIYNAGEEVTYKQYWVDHKQFTGSCNTDGTPTSPNGGFYSEPDTLAKCPKTMTLEILDNMSGALKAEIFVDLWRNDDRASARMQVNGQPTVYASPRGYDWSRTPWIQEIPLSSLKTGTNSIQFWAAYGKYHIYDVAVRIYFDDSHPLLAAGVPVTAPNGELLNIVDDNNVDIPAGAGGALMVNNDKLTLKAHVDAGAKYVEFHAYYDGYDDDNDGVWRDWHNVNRNNWNPGGKAPDAPETGSTINNIGSMKAPAGGGDVTPIDWDLKYIVNQPGVRFKIRIVTADGVVRDAAGGATPEFSLVRDYPVVYYTIPNFDDFGLHMDGSRPDEATYVFPLPNDLDLAFYEKVYLLGMYWKKPHYSFNGAKSKSVSAGLDEWELGVRDIDKGQLHAGNNQLTYIYKGGGGSTVEHPGPMLVLHGNNTGVTDTFAPYVISRQPSAGSTNVDIFAPVVVRMADVGSGIDYDTILMSVNGQQVMPVLSGASNNLTLTYTPAAPYPPQTSILVTVYACDLVGNCLTTSDTFSFETEPPDLTPPVISNVVVNTTSTTATVTWQTNEGATSKVEYGLTTGYGTVVSDAALVTNHSLLLEGLEPAKTYNFRLSGADYFENTSISGNLTFNTKLTAGAIKSDSFSGCELNTSVWSYINPLSDAPLNMTGAGAQISVPGGASHDLWKPTLRAPRLMQFVNDTQEFEVEVKFASTLTGKTQTMGILVQQDADNWLRFNFQSDGQQGGLPLNSIVAVDAKNNNPIVVFSTPVTLGANNYMRVSRVGAVWNLQYSTDGVNWIFATTLTRTLTMNQIGAFIGNTGTNPAFVGVIDYFINTAQPVSKVDPPILLNVTKEGLGTVTPNPAKTSYLCNETVELTATPAPDWVFQGWSGDIISSNPIESLVMTQTQDVVATFTNDTSYTMNVNIVSNGNGVGGKVDKSPDQTGYLYGTPVKLTAAPTAGWSFTGWSGDWTGTELTPTVPVTGNMDITATFDEDEYTIETLILADGVGTGGSIDVQPVQPTYLYGEAVSLTVSVEPGWSFIGWEGQGIPAGHELEPTLTLTMTQDVVAIAHLVQEQYDLNISIINDGEGEEPDNIVLRNPPQDEYGYGQEVGLQVVAVDGWEFAGWAGLLSGQSLSETVTITQDTFITATFTQLHYDLAVTSAGHGTVDIQPKKDYYVYNDVVTLTPVPEKGYDFALWTGDVTGSAAPLFLAITQDFTLEAVFEVDTTPIEILNYNVVIHGGTVAVITWTTDVPGTSHVDYGETAFYEGGTEIKDDLVTNHTITLTGLKPETFYHFQLRSTDADGNEVKSEDLTFSTSASSGLTSDDFSSCMLSDRWTWVNPLGDGAYIESGEQIEISVPADTIHNIYSSDYTVPRLMQPSNDTDFTIEVKFDSVLTNGGTIQGIVIEQDAQNYIRFDTFLRTYQGAPSEVVVYTASFKDLAASNVNNKVRLTDVQGSLWLRVVRTGDKWEQWYSLNGTDWVKSYEFTFDMVVKKAGIFAGNTKYQNVVSAHTAEIDYFFNTASPIVPEDSFYKLTPDVEGSGKIEFKPSKPGYYCGEEVTLVAVPSPGWSFAGWGGDVTGSNPTRNVNVTQDMDIVARFQQGAAGYTTFMPVVRRP